MEKLIYLESGFLNSGQKQIKPYYSISSDADSFYSVLAVYYH